MAKTKNKKNSGLADKVHNKRKAEGIKKKLNPFEVHINREKIKVLGKKSKHDKGLPGVSRAKAIQKRKETLGTEMKLMNKTNAFIDRRIGEKNGQLSAEDRMIARFAAERAKQHNKKNIYNLADDEILTHRGQTLEQIEKFDDPRSDDEEEDGKAFGGLTDEFVSEGHFGGGMLSKTDSKDGAKSHKDLIEQLIAESKKRKAEKQKEKEQTLDLTEKLDSEWKDLQPVVFKKARIENESLIDKVLSQAEKKSADYDKMMRELKFEKRGTPSDSLKSDEKAAKEEREKLAQWEKERRERMEEEPIVTSQVKGKHRSAEDLDDNFELEDEKEFMLAYDKDGKPLVPEHVLKDYSVPNSQSQIQGISDSGSDDTNSNEEDTGSDEENSNEESNANGDDDDDDDDDVNDDDETPGGESELSENEIEESNKVETADKSQNVKVDKKDKSVNTNLGKKVLENSKAGDVNDDKGKKKVMIENSKADDKSKNKVLIENSKADDKSQKKVMIDNSKSDDESSDDDESVSEEEKNVKKDDFHDLKETDDEESETEIEAVEEKIESFFDMKTLEGDNLKNLLSNKSPAQQSIALQKLIKSYDPSLSENNKELLSRLFAHMLQYTNDVFTNIQNEGDLIKAFLTFDRLVPYFFDLAKLNKVSTKNFLIQLLKEKRDRFKKNFKKVPDLDTIIFFKLVSLLYPTSDFAHPVTTPSLIFMSEILHLSKFNDAYSISRGFFITSLILEYTVLSKRLVPAAINFLRGIIFLSANTSILNPIQVVPPFKLHRDSKLLKLESDCSKMAVGNKMAARDLAVKEIDDDYKIRCFATCTLMVKEFFDYFKDLEAQEYLFESHIKLLGRVELEYYPRKVQNMASGVLKDMKDTLEVKTYTPLCGEKKKVKALRLYEPDVQEVFTGSKSSKLSREKAEHARLQSKYKKEMKGALREIRRDKAYIASVKIKQKIHSDNIRKEKVKQIYKDASIQQGELNKLKRMK